MKIKYLFFGFAAFLAVGCVNEDLNPTPTTNGVRVFADMPSTRASFGEGDGVTHVTWQNGDVISLSTDIQSNLQYTAGVGEEGGTVTEFLPVGDNLQNNYKKVVYACYPSAVIDMENMTVPLPNTQNYNDLEFRPFVYAIDTILDDRLELHFHHPYAYLKLTFTEGILPPDTISIGAVKIASDEVIAATSGKFNFVTQAVEAAEGSKTMFIERLGGDGSGHVLKDSPYTLYVPVLPQSEGTKIAIQACYTVGAGVENCYPYYTMEKTVPAGGFQAGHVYTLTMDKRDEPIGREPGIYSLQDLIEFSDATNLAADLSKWKDQNGVINIFADIDMSAAGNWAGIHFISSDEVLEGNGHRVLNWKVEYGEGFGYNYGTNYGFVCNNSGVIRNLIIGEGCTFSGGNMGTTEEGTVCGHNNYSGIISNCISYASVKVDVNFGGICGYNQGVIEECSNYSNIQSGGSVGGIVCANGKLAKKGAISHCFNYGTIESGVCAGGISSSSDASSIVECVNEGSFVLVKGDYTSAGGICGDATGTYGSNNISGCVNKAKVSSPYYAGGIVGTCASSEIMNCQNSGDVSGALKITGGICGIISGSSSSISGNTNKGTVNGVAGTDANDVGSDSSI